MIPKVTATYKSAETNVFNSRKVFILILLYRTFGIANTLVMPQISLVNGPLGCLLSFIVFYIIFGIPIIYMELVVSQFTGRDCIDMWKIRPCLSHVGYFVQCWQIVVFIYNHAIVSVILHYFIVSCENPPLYTRCGYWSTKNCNMMKTNHTANQKCIRVQDYAGIKECDELYTSYPEYQYYVLNLFEEKIYKVFVAWPILVSASVFLVILFFQCFRRIKSIKWFIYPMNLYPMIGYLIILMGSMRQKGLIKYFGQAIDVGFEEFVDRFRSSREILLTVYSVGAGSGVISNLASLAPFRSPCYTNAVISVIIPALFTAIAIVTSAMMVCPYASEYGGPEVIMNHPISFAFIKMPRMLSEYHKRSWWLLLVYSCQGVLGINQNVVIYYATLEILTKRYPHIGKYYALSTLVALVAIFLITTPTLGLVGKEIISIAFRKCFFLVSIFFATMESIVFLVWYGFGRFYEDIHFMQGVQPKNYMKISWMLLSAVLAFVFFNELINLVRIPKSNAEWFGYVLMIVATVGPVMIFLVRLLVAAFQRKFLNQFKLDPMWGPQDDVLRRSRAMFTAHAMTKEYMYRQYHLQAGIVAREQISNTRRNTQNTTSELHVNTDRKN